MKRTLSFFLVLMMILCTCVFAVSAESEIKSSYTRNTISMASALNAQKMYSDAGTRGDIRVKEGVVVGARYTIPNGNKLARVGVSCPSYNNSIGSLTFKVYKWDTDYATTTKQEPVAQSTIVDYTDNSLVTIDIPAGIILTGEILFTVSDPVETVGVYKYSGTTAGVTTYMNGVETDEYAMQGTFYTTTSSPKVDHSNLPSRDPYTVFDMGTFDANNNANKLDMVLEDGQHHQTLTNIKTGAYVAYYKMDFGTDGAKGIVMSVRNDGCDADATQVQFVLDNLEQGPVIGQMNFLYDNQDRYVIDEVCRLEQTITGVHDVFVTFQGTGISPRTLKFVKEDPGLSKFEKKVEAYKADDNEFDINDMYTDTWTMTDMLGRKSADYETAGEYNPDKQVGMFYWTWHLAQNPTPSSLCNIQEVMDTYEGDPAEIKNDYSYYKWANNGYWNESIYGYYHGFDEWVVRKQLQLLSAAGVDVLFTDATNDAQTYLGGHFLVCDIMREMKKNGEQTPKIAFMMPFSPSTDNTVMDLERIYEFMYEPGLYADCWWYWRGKPVVMAHTGQMKKTTGYDDLDAEHQEILEFFNFRPGQPDYQTGPTIENHWPWLECYPQFMYGESEKYGGECMVVGVAQNNNDKGKTAMNGPDVYGRSFTYKDRYSKLSDTSKLYGYNIGEQWERVYEMDPEYVFITGWNEWSALHWPSWLGVSNAYGDAFDDEYSRDIEPSKGELKDAYYCQVVSNIRRFKGVRPTPVATAEKTISLSGGFDQWTDVGPEFLNYRGGTEPRNGWKRNTTGSVQYYTNNTGRNDILVSKVARDAENLYFYVETAEKLSPYTDPSWMRLFINSDRVYKSGWEGYDYVINRVNPTENKAVIEKSTSGWNWETVGEVDYVVDDNKMMISVPRSMVNLTGALDFEFKWSDNMQEQGDIMDFYTNGDTAPIARFSYHFIESREAEKKVEDEPTIPELTPKDKLRYCTVLALNSPVTINKGNYEKVDFANDEIVPQIINDKTMVPIRYLAENLDMGAQVTWVEATQTAKIVYYGTRIVITIGSDEMLVNRDVVKLQSPAVEIGGRILVPLRDIVEATGMQCLWIEPGYIIFGEKTMQFLEDPTIEPYIKSVYEK